MPRIMWCNHFVCSVNLLWSFTILKLMMPSDRNPLREGPGKGDKSRHNIKKFRENWDSIFKKKRKKK